jgi:hypothetical protein
VPASFHGVSWLNVPGLGRSYFLRQVEYRRGPGPSNAWDFTDELHADPLLTQQMFDPESPSLSQSPTEADTTGSVVATYEGTFELRKLVMEWTALDAAIGTDDKRQAGIHLIKLSGGSPTATWDQADFDAVVAAVAAFWDTDIKPYFGSQYTLSRLKFYKAGPQIEPPQSPVYDTSTGWGTGSANNSLPPQVAVSVTEMAGTKPHWGRFYLPAVAEGSCTVYGRLESSLQTAIADSVDTMYQAFKTANVPAVVYRPDLPVREKKNGVELPARDASAWTVDKIQVDDVFDVIRSRRWKNPTLRLQREIT